MGKGCNNCKHSRLNNATRTLCQYGKECDSYYSLFEPIEEKKEQGLKFDSQKVRMELLPLKAVYEVAKVMTYGAEKYAADNWKLLDDFDRRYKGALLRHMVDEECQGDFDEESGLLHLAHEACNALFRLHKKIEDLAEQGIDVHKRWYNKPEKKEVIK